MTQKLAIDWRALAWFGLLAATAAGLCLGQTATLGDAARWLGGLLLAGMAMTLGAMAAQRFQTQRSNHIQQREER